MRWLSAGRPRGIEAKKGGRLSLTAAGPERSDDIVQRAVTEAEACSDRLQKLPFDDHSVDRLVATLSRRLAIGEGCRDRGSPMTGPPQDHSIGGKNVRKSIPVILPMDQVRRLPLVSVQMSRWSHIGVTLFSRVASLRATSPRAMFGSGAVIGMRSVSIRDRKQHKPMQ